MSLSLVTRSVDYRMYFLKAGLLISCEFHLYCENFDPLYENQAILKFWFWNVAWHSTSMRLMEGGTLFVQDRQFRRLKIMGLMLVSNLNKSISGTG